MDRKMQSATRRQIPVRGVVPMRPRLILVSLLLVALPLYAEDPSPDWASFRNGNTLRGIAASKLPEKLELKWKLKLGEMIKSTAAIVDGRVYIGVLSGELICLDLQDGKRIWTYKTVEDVDPNSFAPGFKSSPLVTDKGVYLGDEEGIFHAIDRSTGKKLWTYETSAEIISSASLYKNTLVFGSYDNSLYCLNQADGKLVWQYATMGPVNCSPAVIGNQTFVTGCDEHLRVINVETGKQELDMPLGTYLIASPAVLDDTLYVGTYASEVVAIDWKNQKRIWAFRDPKRDFPYHASAAVTTERIIVGGNDKRLHCLDRLSGKELWVFDTRG
ncbi:MAG: PQQ-binding-like beta-propeller repeat protein, partial [Planctomycetaceae bacterium]|nr:PQQ-binding-like beta-propeller repeat protein [Planctomycetaceae bacterium]